MTHLLRRSTALLALLVVASLSSVVSRAPATAADDVRPAVGECHRVSTQELYADSDPDADVDCAKAHTTRTFLVFDLPKTVDIDDREAVLDVVDKRCTPGWRETVGGTKRQRLLLALGYGWFLPTKAQRSDGARWVRCDLTAWAGRRLAPLTTNADPVISGEPPYADSIARCHLGKRQDYLTTVCSFKHSSRTKGSFVMRGKAYPSDTARYRSAARHCPRITRSKRWISFPPSEESWKLGSRIVLCDSITTN